jgi:hypothetical protein
MEVHPNHAIVGMALNSIAGAVHPDFYLISIP